MEILYISSVPSPTEFQKTKARVRPGVNITRYGMNESGYQFHTLMMEGICAHEGVRVTSLVGRSVCRKTHKGLFWCGVKERRAKDLVCDHLGFINLPVFKHICIGTGMFFKTLCWLFKNRKKPKGIVMDASYISVLPFVLAAKRFFHCKAAAVFCDIYSYMADVRDARESPDTGLVWRIARRVARRCYRRTDAYVFLTEQMNALINGTGKPYAVIEGLVRTNVEEKGHNVARKTQKSVIMYAGALCEAYGLGDLIQGFMDYRNGDAELWIFGDGDYRAAVTQSEAQDARIKFGGAISLEEVAQKEAQATLLINPRPIKREFTRYSFPSKNMEYMASGTPVLTTRLPGMPREYEQYVYLIDGDGAKAITKALQSVLARPAQELREKGQEARAFVLMHKNNVVQSGKVLELLR